MHSQSVAGYSRDEPSEGFTLDSYPFRGECLSRYQSSSSESGGPLQ